MINSFNASIDTNDLKLNDYGGDSSCTEQIDLTNGESKCIHQNLKNSKTRLSLEKEQLSAIENYLDAKIYKEWKEDTPYLVSFHVNFKEDVFGLKEFNIAHKFSLILVNEDKNCLSHKNEIQSKNSDSKYSHLKHCQNVTTYIFITTVVN